MRPAALSSIIHTTYSCRNRSNGQSCSPFQIPCIHVLTILGTNAAAAKSKVRLQPSTFAVYIKHPTDDHDSERYAKAEAAKRGRNTENLTKTIKEKSPISPFWLGRRYRCAIDDSLTDHIRFTALRTGWWILVRVVEAVFLSESSASYGMS